MIGLDYYIAIYFKGFPQTSMDYVDFVDFHFVEHQAIWHFANILMLFLCNFYEMN